MTANSCMAGTDSISAGNPRGQSLNLEFLTPETKRDWRRRTNGDTSSPGQRLVLPAFFFLLFLLPSSCSKNPQIRSPPDQREPCGISQQECALSHPLQTTSVAPRSCVPLHASYPPRVDDEQREPTRREWTGYWSLIVQQTQSAFNDKAAQFLLIVLGGKLMGEAPKQDAAEK